MVNENWEVLSAEESEEYCFQCDTETINLKLILKKKGSITLIYNTCLTCGSTGCEIKE